MPSPTDSRDLTSRWRSKLAVLATVALSFLQAVLGEQKFANQPSPQTAVIGSTVVLPCRIINKVGDLQWTRDDFGLGNERELHAFKRYKMIGADEEGDFSLRISPVTLEDEAYFQCQVTGWRDIPGVRSQTAKLTVYVPPEPPVISQGPLVTTTAGFGVQLECISKGGKPAAELQWLDASGRVVTEGVHYTTELMEDGHRSNARSILSFLADRRHHNSAFTCTAMNPAVRHAEAAQVRLEVRYPPKVTITHDQDGYKEGQTATLTCSADANPNAMTFRWYRNGQLVSNANVTQLVIEQVTKDSLYEDIACEVSNEVGSSKKMTRLIIHYGPSFRAPPSDQYSEIGENATLTCEVDSSPDSTIVWINQDSQTIVGKGPEYRVVVSRDTLGSYLCIAKVDGFPEISATVGIFLKGPPQVRSERQQWGEQGDTVLVECVITAASARSLTVSWTHHGQEIDLETGRYEVIQDVTTRGIRHTLVIRNAQPTDFGAYNCSVQNAYGSDVHEIILIKKKTLPLLLLVGGLSGGILLVVVSVMGIVMCAKRNAARQKANKGYGLPEKTVTVKTSDHKTPTEVKTPLEHTAGSSLGEKDARMGGGGWEKDVEKPPSPTYLASTTSYIYPDTFTVIPLRINGQLANEMGTNSVNYAPQQQPNISTSNGGPTHMNGSTFMPKLPMPTGNNKPYPGYGNHLQHHHQASQGGDPGFLVPGFSSRSFNKDFKDPSGVVVSSTRSNGTVTVPSTPAVVGNGARLGIPMDPVQHIVPSQGQMVEDHLATHV
ncbi:irregular chiasm C-roughest protein-like [Macrobrachium rosenbergii]|uniref:irregular chiasm C-roughest protein-like n=1 Tax=Macrobrachium rosenbergii TaxID=79674 RepID=UPI0034D5A103